jgi:hypothetical protein
MLSGKCKDPGKSGWIGRGYTDCDVIISLVYVDILIHHVLSFFSNVHPLKINYIILISLKITKFFYYWYYKTLI